MIDYVIRKYCSEDYDDVIQLISDGIIDAGTQNPKYAQKYQKDLLINSEVRTDKKLMDYYFASGGTFFVAEWNGKVIGTVGLRIKDKESCLLRRMSVSKEMRGKGIAQSLLNKSYEFLKSIDIKILKLSLWRSNVAAKSLYVKNGFEKSSELMRKHEGEEIPVDFLKKIL